MKEVPTHIRIPITKLLSIQDEHNILQAEFNKKVLELEMEYEAKFAPLYADRASIVRGSGAEKVHTLFDFQGISSFWLDALKNNYMIGEMIMETDEPALASLVDIQYTRLADNHSFKLEFFFDKNNFFTNSILTKTFHFAKCCEYEDQNATCGTAGSSSAAHEELYRFDRMEGTAIDWLPGANLTVKVVKKTQRHKTKNITRVVEREEKVNSFFLFFDTATNGIQTPSNGDKNEHGPDDEENDGEVTDEVAIHLELGDIIRSKIVPDAVTWYLGIADDETAPFDDGDDEDLGDYNGEDDDLSDPEEDDNEEDSKQEEKLYSRRFGGDHRRQHPSANQNCKQQ